MDNVNNGKLHNVRVCLIIGTFWCIGSFRKYDFGPKENMKLYGQEYPPKYNLSATRVPAAFFIGPSDSMITKPVSMFLF